MKKIFFPRNMDDREIEFTKEELPDNCHKYLAELWDNEQTMRWEEVL